MFKIYLVPVAILNSSSSEMLTQQSMCVSVSDVCLSVCWYISRHRADVHHIYVAEQSYWLVHYVYLPIAFHPSAIQLQYLDELGHKIDHTSLLLSLLL